MTKKELRKIFRDKRNSLSMSERAKMDDLMLIQFQALKLPVIYSLLSYWPIERNNEPNMHLFTDYMAFRNPELIIAYPKTDLVANNMHAISTNESSRFAINDFGIYEPEKGEEIAAGYFDMIFVPLLAVDKKGYRVGYGKGYYDKFMVDCREDCVRIGFSYFEPIQEMPDKHEFDVPLNLCITPQSVYVF